MPKAEPTTTEIASLSPEALAAFAKATVEATAALNPKREIENPPPAFWNGFGLPDFPKFKYEKVFFCGARQEPKNARREEIQLFNKITRPGLYGPDKTWEVRIANNELQVNIQRINKKEVRMELPRSLVDILQIIVDEQNAVAA